MLYIATCAAIAYFLAHYLNARFPGWITAIWSSGLAAIVGLVCGSLIVLGGLSLMGAPMDHKAIPQTLIRGFIWSVIAACFGVFHGRKKAAAEESEHKNKTALPVPYMIGAAAVILSAIFWFSTGGSGEKSAAQPRQTQWDTENIATCILDQMPEVQNDITANAVLQVCIQKHPDGMDAVTQGSGRGPLGFDSGAECTADKATDTRSDRAAALIRQACMRLYDEPKPIIDWDQYELVSPPPTIDWDQYELASPPSAQ